MMNITALRTDRPFHGFRSVEHFDMLRAAGDVAIGREFSWFEQNSRTKTDAVVRIRRPNFQNACTEVGSPGGLPARVRVCADQEGEDKYEQCFQRSGRLVPTVGGEHAIERIHRAAAHGFEYPFIIAHTESCVRLDSPR